MSSTWGDSFGANWGDSWGALFLSGGTSDVTNYKSLNVRRTKEDVKEARKEYGLVFDVIEKVALRQSEQLITDEQKIFDELYGELKLLGLEIESRYFDLLNKRREALIAEARIRQEDENLLMILASII